MSVGSSRNEGCGGKRLNLRVREGENPSEQTLPQLASNLRRRTRGEKPHRDGGEHHDSRHAEHLRPDREQIRHLQRPHVVAELFVFRLRGRNGLLLDDGVVNARKSRFGLSNESRDFFLGNGICPVCVKQGVEIVRTLALRIRDALLADGCIFALGGSVALLRAFASCEMHLRKRLGQSLVKLVPIVQPLLVDSV